MKDKNGLLKKLQTIQENGYVPIPVDGLSRESEAWLISFAKMVRKERRDTPSGRQTVYVLTKNGKRYLANMIIAVQQYGEGVQDGE